MQKRHDAKIACLILLVLALPSLILGSAVTTAGVEQGTMVELALTWTTAYTNRFDVQLRAIFTQDSTRYIF